MSGLVAGSGDLDGDGLDDVAVVSPESQPGGASVCDSDSSRVRILPGTTAATLTLAQTLAFPEAGYGSFVGRVRIVGDLDAGGSSSLVIVGVQKTLVYTGPLGGLVGTKQLFTPQFPDWPMIGF